MATIQDHKAFAEIIFGKEKADIMFGSLEEKENNKTVFETSTGKTVKLILQKIELSNQLKIYKSHDEIAV